MRPTISLSVSLCVSFFFFWYYCFMMAWLYDSGLPVCGYHRHEFIFCASEFRWCVFFLCLQRCEINGILLEKNVICNEILCGKKWEWPHNMRWVWEKKTHKTDHSLLERFGVTFLPSKLIDVIVCQCFLISWLLIYRFNLY